jgi:hypothetical protein
MKMGIDCTKKLKINWQFILNLYVTLAETVITT